MSNNAGRVKPGHRVAEQDASFVQRIKAAGAIPLLVSNTPELCMCWETFNNVTGRTNNPYDIRRSPGGSSGGEVSTFTFSTIPTIFVELLDALWRELSLFTSSTIQTTFVQPLEAILREVSIFTSFSTVLVNNLCIENCMSR